MSKKQPWRPRYALRLGLRPSARDEETGDVRTVECGFCAAFGREPPAEDAPKRLRARTANVATWSAPFRPDNVRTHHRAQHTDKWRAYSELQQQLCDAGDATAAEWQLKAFFETAIDQPTRKRPRVQQAAVTAEATRPKVAATQDNRSATGQKALLLEIATSEIVETLVDGFYVDDDGYTGAQKGLDVMQRVLVDDLQVMQKETDDRCKEKLVLTATKKHELVNVQQLLGIGLTFVQVAQCVASPAVSANTVRRYARLSVASSLQMISTIMRRTWIYSIAFQILGGSRGNAVLQLRIRLPVSRGTHVADFHVIAVPLPSFESSTERIAVFIELVLETLDSEWRSKLLGGCVNGAANEMGAHASLLDDMIQQSTSSCLYRVRRPAQIIEACLRSVLQDLGKGRYERPPMTDSTTQEKGNFLQEMVTLTTFLRGYDPWVRIHGRCPQFDPECSWSTLKGLQWVMARRHIILDVGLDNPSVQLPPSSFWLVSSVLIDTIAVFKDALRNLESFPLPPPAECNRTIARCIDVIIEKCKISRDTGIEIAAQVDMFLEGDDVLRGEFRWARKAALVPYLRSLNLSSRRLYDEMVPGDKRYVEWLLGSFILNLLHSVSENSGPDLLEGASSSTTSSSTRTMGSKTMLCDPPPTLPLEFTSIERMAAVDLIERYSERLEQAHGLVFLDSISHEIELLKTMTIDNPSLRLKIKGAQAKSFRSAWETVPELESLRVFAAGLATVLPRTVGGSNQGLSTETALAVVAALQERDEDQHRVNFGELSVEARLHMEQVQIVRALYSE
ncbi:hypothetical protein PRNP1_006397 [Phytophthora ramorum]